MLTFGDIVPPLSAPLHDDLVPHVRAGRFGKMVHHKYVIGFLSMGDDFCHHINTAYEEKTRLVEEALTAGAFGKVVRLHERPYRFDALNELVQQGHLLPDTREYWEVVRSVWLDSENIHENIADWRHLWGQGENRYWVMTESERAHLMTLPDTVQIYRGYLSLHRETATRGLSWTTDRSRALWFAHRFSQEANFATPRIDYARVRREHIYAYLDGRSENEIVVDPANFIKQENIPL